jgi:hypothetical protein
MISGGRPAIRSDTHRHRRHEVVLGDGKWCGREVHGRPVQLPSEPEHGVVTDTDRASMLYVKQSPDTCGNRPLPPA